MNPNSELVKAIKTFYQKLCKNSPLTIKEQSLWLLRTFLITRRQADWVNAGFVLPTVAMVALIVVLLTTAILFRSFERSKNASNVRVNQAVLNAAAPAIDRARAKLDALFDDPTLPRGTPSDSVLYDAIKKDKYSLGDETRLKLAYNINGIDGQTTTALEDDETLKTAWKFAVDTDNNGLKDSYTLYAIYFRTPTRDATTGQFNRKRNPLEARTPPMDNDSTNQRCPNAIGFSSLVGNSSWYKLQSGNLGKSFFVYTVNVPITNLGSLNPLEYEPYKGNKGFVALEFQQDRSRIPLAYNAVWYENDLEIITGATELKLNGRIHTNGNLLVGVTDNRGNMTFRQVSSKSSCFYNQETGQISVGGNVGNGSLAQTAVKGVTIDLYQGFNQTISTADIDSTNKSTGSTGGSEIGFNDAAYNKRIAAMKTDAIALCTTCQNATATSGFKTAVAASSYPDEVRNNVAQKVNNSDDIATAKDILSQEIEIYLRNRTRRVPFAEVPGASGTVDAIDGYTTAVTTSLNPPQAWREPLDSSNNLTGTTISVSTSQLNAVFPDFQKEKGLQFYLGDRILVGNNLPAKWLQGSDFVGPETPQSITSSGANVNWTEPPSPQPQQNKPRWRNTQIQAIADLGISDRNGFWEKKAAENPTNPLDSVGGVRIVTGAGIYIDGHGVSNAFTGPFYGGDDYSFLPRPDSADDTVVWPDTMPMSSPAQATKKGDLLMRATAVYHYKIDSGTDQDPIACVSSYYDPTNETTVKNKVNVNGGYGVDTTNGRSNNGVVYNFPGRSNFTTYKTLLTKQANLKFPNRRPVNEALKEALDKIGSGTTVPNTGLQLADYSAIDTALCAISILNNEAGFVATPSNQPPHGAIKEASFLDGREAKQISLSSTPTTYDLDLEQRQPLEIRVTDINLGVIANTEITPAGGTTEYLLPYSGIIYATRDDALADESEPRTNSEYKLLSPTDFKLDSTRRPNGIRLINGATLARKPGTKNNEYDPKEKGLILVSNLPAYIRDKFNLHRTTTSSTTEIEEFTQTEPTTNFYARSTPETKFACRIGRTGCSSTASEGDFWRPATIIADAMTLLSSAFEDGNRSQGDYDLNYNTSISVETNLNPPSLSTSLPATLNERRKNRLKNGFWENNFVTSAEWWQTTGVDKNFPNPSLGSYLFNGVTPIQRRVDNNPMYVMEFCRKDLVSECGAGDWYVGFNVNGDDDLEDTVSFDANGDGDSTNDKEKDVKANKLGQAIIAAGGDPISSWDTAFGTAPNNKSIRERLGAGDTGSKALVAADRRYPRRVAFARNGNNLVSTSPGIYKPMGIGCPLDTTGSIPSGNGCTYGGTTEGTHYGKRGNSALWFRTTSSSSNPGSSTNDTYRNDNSLFYYPPIDADGNSISDLDGQPLLVPVLQIHDAKNTLPATAGNGSVREDKENQLQNEFRLKWLKVPNANTTFNATFVVGNSPSRSDEVSAGLQNFVRFLESWFYEAPDHLRTAKISGSFIQLKRSSFATAPLAPIFRARQATNDNATGSVNLSLFNYALDSYPTPNSTGMSPFYSPPNRSWGFDVGLLSEQPDLFAQRFTLPPTGRPNEFFREVGREDIWVKTLLCAGEPGASGTYTRAVPTEYRPDGCPTIPND